MDTAATANELKQLLQNNIVRTLVELENKHKKYEKLGDESKLQIIVEELQFVEAAFEVMMDLEERRDIKTLGLCGRDVSLGVYLALSPVAERLSIKDLAATANVSQPTVQKQLDRFCMAVAKELEELGYAADQHTQSGL